LTSTSQRPNREYRFGETRDSGRIGQVAALRPSRAAVFDDLGDGGVGWFAVR
jgi:hypothetical protein